LILLYAKLVFSANDNGFPDSWMFFSSAAFEFFCLLSFFEFRMEKISAMITFFLLLHFHMLQW